MRLSALCPLLGAISVAQAEFPPLSAQSLSSTQRLRHHVAQAPALGRPSTVNCTWVRVEQPLSHFARGAVGTSTYLQRLCVYDGFWGGAAAAAPIFFYTGNESPLDEYINSTGLMWEAAPNFRALLVWAEHRYFGESVPKLQGLSNCLSWLTSEEALADYAALLERFRTDEEWRWHAPKSPVVAFGGSYGGMLSAWMRMKYPNLVAGAVSASAPIWGFPRSVGDLLASAVQLTNAALPVGGAAESCVPNLKASWVLITALSSSAEGRQLISKAMGLCEPLATAGDAQTLLGFLQAPLFNLAEGSYPFPTNYITYATDNGTKAPLPAWPMRAVCEPLGKAFGVSLSGDVVDVRFQVHVASTFNGEEVISVDWDQVHSSAQAHVFEETGVPALLAAVAKGLQVWFNVTGTSKCLDWRGSPPIEDPSLKAEDTCTAQSIDVGTAWGALTCNDGMNLVNTAVHGFGRDLYWPPSHARNVTMEEVVKGSMAYCRQFKGQGLVGVPEQPDEWGNWMEANYGGREITAHSNIFFSNGQLDPWTGGGVLPPGPSERLPAAIIVLGGHHLDLFWSTKEDPSSVRDVRNEERALIRTWIAAARGHPHPSIVV